MEYTNEQYQRVLNKSADMKNAIDELQAMTKNGIASWTEFGKCLDAIYKARDEYMKAQHEIVLEATQSDKEDQKVDTKNTDWIYETGRDEPEILGSGSHLYNLIHTKDEAEAFKLSKECGRNYIERYRYVNGEKVSQWYNQFAKTWEDN